MVKEIGLLDFCGLSDAFEHTLSEACGPRPLGIRERLGEPRPLAPFVLVRLGEEHETRGGRSGRGVLAQGEQGRARRIF